MAYHPQVDNLRARIYCLRHEINRAFKKEHPIQEAGIVYSTLLKVLDSRSYWLEEAIENNYTSDASREVALAHATRAIEKDLKALLEVFHLAYPVDSSRIPFEILGALSRAAEDLLGHKKCRVIVGYPHSHNYSIVSFLTKLKSLGWEKEWRNALEEHKQNSEADQEIGTSYEIDLDYDIYILRLPFTETGAVLAHANIAHEFGHEVVHKFEMELREAQERAIVRVVLTHKELIKRHLEMASRLDLGVDANGFYESARRRILAQIVEISQHWVPEMFADLVAARLLGPAFLAALQRIHTELGRTCHTQPPVSVRCKLIDKYLQSELPHVLRNSVWKASVEYKQQSIEASPSDSILLLLAEEVCSECLDSIAKYLDNIPSPLAVEGKELEYKINEMEEHIEKRSPPSAAIRASEICSSHLWLIFYAAWHFRLNNNRFRKFLHTYGLDEDGAEHALGDLVLHAVHSLDCRLRLVNTEGSDLTVNVDLHANGRSGDVVGENEILERIYGSGGNLLDWRKRLVIEPLFPDHIIIQEPRNSMVLDLHLGNSFTIPQRKGMSGGRLLCKDVEEAPIARDPFVHFGRELILYPGEIVLGSTLEWLTFPPDLMGYVAGRSIWGRRGLLVVTAAAVHPSSAGRIPLLLRNVGETPVYLKPGVVIGGLFLHRLEGAEGASG